MDIATLQQALTKLETEADQGLRPELAQSLKLEKEMDSVVARWHELLRLLRETNTDYTLYKYIRIKIRQLSPSEGRRTSD